MGKIFNISLPTHPEVHSYFIIADLHSLFLHWPTFNIMRKHAKAMPEAACIINGDLFDLPFFMKKNKDFQKHIKYADGMEGFFIPEFGAEIDIVNHILDLLQSVFKRVIYIGGNHDDLRINEFKEVCPSEYRYHFDLKERLRLKKRNIPFVPYGDYLDIGDHTIKHGSYHASTAWKKHYEEADARNVVVGHIHRSGLHSFHSRGNTKLSWSLPAMCNLDMKYMRKKETNWSNGYGILNVRPDGKCHMNIFHVIEKTLVLPCGLTLKGSDDEELIIPRTTDGKKI